MIATPTKTSTVQDVKSISLDMLMSQKNRDTLRGVVGMDSEQIGDRYVRGDRTPENALYAMARDCFGVERWCKQNGLPAEEALVYFDKTAFELGLSEAYKQKEHDSLKPETCLPSVLLASNKGDLLLWARVKECAPILYEQHCPPTMKDLVEREKVRRGTEPGSTRMVDHHRFHVPPNTQETQSAIAFRDHLTASLLREWRLYVMGIVDPFNVEKLKQINDFIAKFQRTGYHLDTPILKETGGLTTEMVVRLKDIEQTMKHDLAEGKEVLRQIIKVVTERLGNEILYHPSGFQITVRGSDMGFEILVGEKVAVIATESDVVTAESNRLSPPYSMALLPDFVFAGLFAQYMFMVSGSGTPAVPNKSNGGKKRGT